MFIPHFVHPFICQWTPALLPLLGYCESRHYDRGCANIYPNPALIPLEIYPEVGHAEFLIGISPRALQRPDPPSHPCRPIPVVSNITASQSTALSVSVWPQGHTLPHHMDDAGPILVPAWPLGRTRCTTLINHLLSELKGGLERTP